MSFFIWGDFLPFYPPPKSPKTENFKKMKKNKKHLEISSFYTSVPKIMIICNTVLEMWHMTDVIIIIIGYAVLEIWYVTYVIVVFHFGQFFALLSPPNNPNKENFKKWKKHQEISSFYICVPKTMIICYTVPEIWHMTDVTIFYFRLFFALLPPKQPKKSKFQKNEKNNWGYHHFTQLYQKLWL